MTYNQMSDTEKNAIATGTSGKTFTGATGTEKYNIATNSGYKSWTNYCRSSSTTR
jgi:hypothetical protein